MKTQKGITLIALIITIIVMLILVGVSVSVALNTGLFKAAQGAAKNTEAEKIKETKLSSEKITIKQEDGTVKEVDINSFGVKTVEPQIGEYVSYSAGGVDTWRVIKNDGEKVVIAGVITDMMAYFNNYTTKEKTDAALAKPLKVAGVGESAEFISPFEYTSYLTGIKLEEEIFNGNTGLTISNLQSVGLTEGWYYEGWCTSEAYITEECTDGIVFTWWNATDWTPETKDDELMWYYTDFDWGNNGKGIASVTLLESVTFSGEGTELSPYTINP